MQWFDDFKEVNWKHSLLLMNRSMIPIIVNLFIKKDDVTSLSTICNNELVKQIRKTLRTKPNNQKISEFKTETMNLISCKNVQNLLGYLLTLNDRSVSFSPM